MITEMTRYTLFALTDHTATLITSLQEMGVMDIRRSHKCIDEHSAALLQKAEGIKEIMTGKELKALQNSKRMQAAALEKELAAAKLWGSCDNSALNELGQAGCSLEFHSVATKSFNNAWEQEHAISVIGEERGRTFFVVVNAPGEGPSELPGLIEKPRSIMAIQKELDSALAESASAGAKLASLNEMLPQLQAKYNAVMTELDGYLASKASVLSSDEDENALTGYLNVFEGFAPESERESICEKLDAMSLYYTAEKAVEDDTPIKLHNNRFAREFELFTGMYGMPVYGEFDPTPVLAPFFLLFFSMCMGDAGYGLLLMLIALVLKNKMPDSGLGKMHKLVFYLGAGTFIIGIVLGTFFGIPLYEASWVPAWLKKCLIVEGNVGKVAGRFDPQMVLSLGIGVFHLCLAMIMKTACQTQRNGFKNSLSTWGWTLLIVGGVITAALSVFGLLGGDALKWTVICIAVLSGLGIFIFNTPGRNPLINIGSGLWDSYNMASGLLGDTLSYIRLYALGLAGGMLGGAFNNLGTMVLGDNPTWQWLPFLLIVVFGHALNLAMSCLGAFVHPLRLNFVEYFKNAGYDGKGVKYQPLTKEINK